MNLQKTSVIFFMLYSLQVQAMDNMHENQVVYLEGETTQRLLNNDKLRAAVKKRIKDFQESGLHTHLNSPFLNGELGLPWHNYSDEWNDLCRKYSAYSPLFWLISGKKLGFPSNIGLIYELLENGAEIYSDVISKTIKEKNISKLLLLLPYMNQKSLCGTLGESFDGNGNSETARLALLSGAPANCRNDAGDTLLFLYIQKIIEESTKCISDQVEDNNSKRDYDYKKATEMLELLLAFGANPHIKNTSSSNPATAGKSAHDLVEKLKNSLQESVLGKNLDPREFEELTAHFKQQDSPVRKMFDFFITYCPEIFKKSVDERIERMTNFLHTRASQTPFTIKDITKKIAEHMYKDDMHVSRQDWDKLAELVSK